MKLRLYNYVMGMTTYTQSKWRCNNVGSLREHVTCHMFDGFSGDLGLTLFLGPRWAHAGELTLMINTLHMTCYCIMRYHT